MANVYSVLRTDIDRSAFSLPVAVFSSAATAGKWVSEWAFDDEVNVALRQAAISEGTDFTDSDLADFALYDADSGEKRDPDAIKAAFRSSPGKVIYLTDNTRSVHLAMVYQQTF